MTERDRLNLWYTLDYLLDNYRDETIRETRNGWTYREPQDIREEINKYIKFILELSDD